LNHGAGVEQATENTRELAETWMERWKQAHPDTKHFSIPAAQLALPI
jgi:hypothetical protein